MVRLLVTVVARRFMREPYASNSLRVSRLGLLLFFLLVESTRTDMFTCASFTRGVFRVNCSHLLHDTSIRDVFVIVYVHHTKEWVCY